jgi:hypothetical protein
VIRFWSLAALWHAKWCPHILLWYVGIPITSADVAGMDRDCDRVLNAWLVWNGEEEKQ